ncbi:MAG: adenylate/guanylate cyclase domain-containing protein [Spirochaetales bacterium]|nr:adenylate/guanylate cyclase domain-containing protein [Spirochaetales bacterium]
MCMAKKTPGFFQTRNFGLIIGLLVFLAIFAVSTRTVLIDNLELNVLDFNFRLKNVARKTRVQEGVTVEQRNPRISPDILIIGIDDRSLDSFGRWPFPRYTHANLISTFTQIKTQNERERALFLDVAFVEPSQADYDALLVDSIRANDRVFLEPFLSLVPNPPGTEEGQFARQDVLFERYGKITHIVGDWTKVLTMYGVFAPLKPYARAAHGYGHPNFAEDPDQVYRRQPLIVKLSRFVDEIPLQELRPESLTEQEREEFHRLAWIDENNAFHDVPYPVTETVIENLTRTMERRAPLKAEDTNNDNEPDLYYHVVRKYKDDFLPSITLSLALEHLNKRLDDIEVVLGKHVRIPAPQQYNTETQSWEPFQLVVKPPVLDAEGAVLEPAVTRVKDEILIPINDKGQLLVNFMGIASSASPQGHQTFPVRSFSGYASRVPPADPERWPRTMGVGNKLLMVGAFAKGIAEDEKTTPFGLMYGVEIHANALNTILMNNFLYYLPRWSNALILLAMALLTAFMASRLPTIWSLVLSLVLIVAFFFAVTVIFDLYNLIITLSAPVFAVLLSFLAVIVYRIMTEEKDKRRIRDMFGKYVSPQVVDQILENPPELGGIDKELTVLFSDIRGFTNKSESMPPQELVRYLNTYLTAMTDVVFEYRGTLDKYVGDEIMCFWGAPLPQEEHAILACKCAVRQMEVLGELNAQWPTEWQTSIGIGLNSGIMTVGNMGSLGRMNYTLTGDNVNLGARLEGTNKTYGTGIIMSEYTYGLVKDRVVARELDNIRVKGKNKPVLIYELVDVIDGLAPPEPREERDKRKG